MKDLSTMWSMIEYKELLKDEDYSDEDIKESMDRLFGDFD